MQKILLKINQWGIIFILTVPFWLSNEFIFPYIHLKNIFFRTMVVILLFTTIWYILEKKAIPKIKNLVLIGLGIFLSTQILATIFSVNPAQSLFGNWERMDGLLNLFLLGGYFWIITIAFQSKADWLKILRVMPIIANLLIVFSLFKNGFALSDNNWSTVGNSSFLGFYLLLNIGLVAVAFVIDQNKKWKIFYVASFILLFLSLLGVSSRAPILGLLLGIFLSIILSLKQTSKKFKLIFAGSLVVLILLSGLSYWQRDSKVVQNIYFLNRITHISRADQSTNNRLLIWQSGWQAFKDRPVLGYGPENTPVGTNKYYNPLITEQWFDRVHNFVIDYLMSSGVIGLLGYLSLLGLAGYSALRIRKRRQILGNILLGILSAYLFTELFSFNTINTWIFVMVILALTGWLKMHYSDSELVEESESNFLAKNYYLILGLTIVVALIFHYNAVIIPVQANYLTGEAIKYSQADPDKSLALYDKALVLDAYGQREIVLQLNRYSLQATRSEEASLQVKNKVFKKAEEETLVYLDKNNNDIQARMSLAQTYLAYSSLNTFYPDEVISLLENNLADSPKRMEVYYMIAQAYYLKNDLEQAINYLEQAYKITDKVSSVYVNLMNIYSQAGKKDKLVQIAEKYIENFSLKAEEYRKIGEYYFRVGLINEAKRILSEKAIPANTDDWGNYVALASIYEYEGKYQKAIDYLTEILAEHPEFEEVLGPYIEELEKNSE